MPPAFDTGQVSPSDAAVTLRSLRRRFAEVLNRPRPAEASDDPVHRRSPDGGLSPVEHAAWTATALAAIDRALRRTLAGSDPRVELAPVDPDRPIDGGDLGAEAVVARVGDAAEALAEVVAGAHGAEWTRTARTSDGGQVTALAIARLAVRIGIEHLRAAERAPRT